MQPAVRVAQGRLASVATRLNRANRLHVTAAASPTVEPARSRSLHPQDVLHGVPLAPPLQLPPLPPSQPTAPQPSSASLIVTLSDPASTVSTLHALLALPEDAVVSWHVSHVENGTTSSVLLSAYVDAPHSFSPPGEPRTTFLVAKVDAGSPQAALLRRFFRHAPGQHVWHDLPTARRLLSPIILAAEASDDDIAALPVHADAHSLAVLAAAASAPKSSSKPKKTTRSTSSKSESTTKTTAAATSTPSLLSADVAALVSKRSLASVAGKLDLPSYSEIESNIFDIQPSSNDVLTEEQYHFACLQAAAVHLIHERASATLRASSATAIASQTNTHSPHQLTQGSLTAGPLCNAEQAYHAFFSRVDAALSTITARGAPLCARTATARIDGLCTTADRRDATFRSWATSFSPDADKMDVSKPAQLRHLLFAPCNNKHDCNKSLPEQAEFSPAPELMQDQSPDSANKTESWLEKRESNKNSAGGGSKRAPKSKKKREKIVLHGGGLTAAAHTPAGWPSTSMTALSQTAASLQESNAPASEALSALVEASSLRRRATRMQNDVLPLIHNSLSNEGCEGQDTNLNAHTGARLHSHTDIGTARAHWAGSVGAADLRATVRARDGCKLVVASAPAWPRLWALSRLSGCDALNDVLLTDGAADAHSAVAARMFDDVAHALTHEKVCLNPRDNGASTSAGKPVQSVREAFPREVAAAAATCGAASRGNGPAALARGLGVSRADATQLLRRWDSVFSHAAQWRRDVAASSRAHSLLGRIVARTTAGGGARSGVGARGVDAAVGASAAEGVLAVATGLEQCDRLRALQWRVVLVDGAHIVLHGPQFALRAALPVVGDVQPWTGDSIDAGFGFGEAVNGNDMHGVLGQLPVVARVMTTYAP